MEQLIMDTEQHCANNGDSSVDLPEIQNNQNKKVCLLSYSPGNSTSFDI